ncbi:MAG: transposase [Cyclobacteriaceae bacterium]
MSTGGLSDDGMEWIDAGKKFFLPVKALSSVFRGVMWSMFEKHIKSGKIKLADNFSDVEALKKAIYAKKWNVYSKKPLAGPKSVVQYLGKYTHRVAISNSRLVSMSEGKVTFRWKDYRKRLSKQLLTLDSEEFIGRFMRHILPSGFYKIRYYGLLASANHAKKEQCMTLIGKDRPVPLLQGLKAKEVLQIVTGKEPDRCSKCEIGKMIPKTILDPV